MSQNTGFIAHKKLTLETDLTYRTIAVTGQVFICTLANYTFEMQFNDGGWFQFDQGLQFNVAPDRFTKLAFRALNITEATQVEFYTGGAQLADARLNIIRDPNRYQLLQSLPPTRVKAFAAASIAAGADVKFYGTGGTSSTQAGVLYNYRKAIVVTNNDPLNDLEIFDCAGAVVGNRMGTVFPRQAWYLETSTDICVKNETGAAIACRVAEVFYPA
jgi:hypothetical protein